MATCSAPAADESSAPAGFAGSGAVIPAARSTTSVAIRFVVGTTETAAAPAPEATVSVVPISASVVRSTVAGSEGVPSPVPATDSTAFAAVVAVSSTAWRAGAAGRSTVCGSEAAASVVVVVTCWATSVAVVVVAVAARVATELASVAVLIVDDVAAAAVVADVAAAAVDPADATGVAAADGADVDWAMLLALVVAVLVAAAESGDAGVPERGSAAVATGAEAPTRHADANSARVKRCPSVIPGFPRCS